PPGANAALASPTTRAGGSRRKGISSGEPTCRDSRHLRRRREIIALTEYPSRKPTPSALTRSNIKSRRRARVIEALASRVGGFHANDVNRLFDSSACFTPGR